MQVGIFADAHDHVDNVRMAVSLFNSAGCGLVVFAGDFCSPIVLPPMRKLECPMIACFGDNDGNKVGLQSGMGIIGILGEPPFCFQTADGTRFLLTHREHDLRGLLDDCEIVIYAHTHRAKIAHDENRRLFVNPGETAGWTYREPSIAILDTELRKARLLSLAGITLR